jgi:hypothetical protein
MVLSVQGITPLNSVNQLIFVMVKCGVLFEVRTESSSIYIYKSQCVYVCVYVQD